MRAAGMGGHRAGKPGSRRPVAIVRDVPGTSTQRHALFPSCAVLDQSRANESAIARLRVGAAAGPLATGQRPRAVRVSRLAGKCSHGPHRVAKAGRGAGDARFCLPTGGCLRNKAYDTGQSHPGHPSSWIPSKHLAGACFVNRFAATSPCAGPLLPCRPCSHKPLEGTISLACIDRASSAHVRVRAGNIWLRNGCSGVALVSALPASCKHFETSLASVPFSAARLPFLLPLASLIVEHPEWLVVDRDVPVRSVSRNRPPVHRCG
jgi:hypothetical protein